MKTLIAWLVICLLIVCPWNHAGAVDPQSDAATESPEFRTHYFLERLLESLNYDPLAVANFVMNEVRLVDAIGAAPAKPDFGADGKFQPTDYAATFYENGLSRGALAVAMERAGSPIEQCALLVYLLRECGIPAAYARLPEGGLKVPRDYASQMLGVDLETMPGFGSSAESWIGLDYPWVIARVEDQWVHLFPWLKDYRASRGLNLYDYLPEGWRSGEEILEQYNP